LPEGVRVNIKEKAGWLRDKETGEEKREEEVKAEIEEAFETLDDELIETETKAITASEPSAETQEESTVVPMPQLHKDKIKKMKDKIKQKNYKDTAEYINNEYEEIEKDVPGRDVGKSIQLNTRAIQQLIEIIETGNYTIERTVIINQTAAPLPLLQNETLLNQTLINQTSLNETAINQSLINQTLINATQPVNLTLPANQTAILELNQKILELETRLAALESMLEQVNGSVIIRFG